MVKDRSAHRPFGRKVADTWLLRFTGSRPACIFAAMKSSSLCLFLLLLTSCATNYQGGSPNFDLKGKAAGMEEVRKYRLSDSFWTTGQFLRFEGSGQAHTLESMDPLVRSVSPEAAMRLVRAKDWFVAQGVLFGIALGGFIVLLADGNGTGKWSFPFAVGSGLASIACGFVGSAQVSAAASEYNSALAQRFAFRKGLVPTLSFRLPF